MAIPLEEPNRFINFAMFRPAFVTALSCGVGFRVGRPSYDAVAIFKLLILAAQNNVNDARMEYLIRNYVIYLCFLGFDLDAAKPDANTIRMFRERLIRGGANNPLFDPSTRSSRHAAILPWLGKSWMPRRSPRPGSGNRRQNAAIKEGSPRPWQFG